MNSLQPRTIGAVNYVGLYTLVKREVGRFVNVYLQTIVAPVITTLLFYTVFALAFGGVAREINGLPFLEFLAPGLIMMTMVQNAFANTSSSMVIAKVQGNIVDILLPPLSPIEIYVGYVVGGIARGVVVGGVTGLVMSMFVDIHIHSWFYILSYGVLGTLLLSSLGLAGGIWSDKFDHIAAVTNFVVTPLTFLSGTFYALESLPEFWQKLAHYNPFFYMIDGFRSGFIGMSDGNLTLGLVYLLVINIGLATLSYRMLSTGYKIKA